MYSDAEIIKFKRKKRNLYFFILFAMMNYGLHATVSETEDGVSLIYSFVIGISLIYYCHYISKIKNKGLSWGEKFGMYVTFPISCPLYIFWDNGLKGIHYSILTVTPIILVFFVPYLVIYYALY